MTTVKGPWIWHWVLPKNWTPTILWQTFVSRQTVLFMSAPTHPIPPDSTHTTPAPMPPRTTSPWACPCRHPAHPRPSLLWAPQSFQALPMLGAQGLIRLLPSLLRALCHSFLVTLEHHARSSRRRIISLKTTKQPDSKLDNWRPTVCRKTTLASSPVNQGGSLHRHPRSGNLGRLLRGCVLSALSPTLTWAAPLYQFFTLSSK